MRLNQPLDCPDCGLKINPFIYRDANGYADKGVECPACGFKFVARVRTVSGTVGGEFMIFPLWEGVRVTHSD